MTVFAVRANGRTVTTMTDNELFGISEQLNDTISRQGVLRLLNAVPSEEFATKAMLISGVNALPSAQPDENDQEFIKLTVRNSNGRPYYSIIYLEYDKNGVGHDFEGYSSYSLDVISDYLKKYFMPSAQPQRMRGKWTYGEDEYGIDGYHCDKCGFFLPWDYTHKFIDFIKDYHFCPNCGADMRGEQDGSNKD